MSHFVSSAALGLAIALGAAGCGHDVREGHYRLHRTEAPSEDGCGLLDPQGGLPDLYLARSGDDVDIDLELFGPQQPVRMIGRFKDEVDGEPEQLSADGSFSSRPIEVGDASCLVAFGQVRIDATLPEGDSGSFSGTLSVDEKLADDEGGPCPALCRLVVAYRAEEAP